MKLTKKQMNELYHILYHIERAYNLDQSDIAGLEMGLSALKNFIQRESKRVGITTRAKKGTSVTIVCKAKYTRSGIPEVVCIVHNPYMRPISEVIKLWIEPEFVNQVYGIRS